MRRAQGRRRGLHVVVVSQPRVLSLLALSLRCGRMRQAGSAAETFLGGVIAGATAAWALSIWRRRTAHACKSALALGSGVTRIVFTGGPCAGKTSCVAFVRDYLAARGIKAVIVPEVATFFVNCGSSFDDLTTDEKLVRFQVHQLLTQLHLEERPGAAPLSRRGPLGVRRRRRGGLLWQRYERGAVRGLGRGARHGALDARRLEEPSSGPRGGQFDGLQRQGGTRHGDCRRAAEPGPEASVGVRLDTGAP
mmetsp:Transcript_34879/g.96245  ORF Transcript_34879/g.96245 Transcript_34879/m.96245 type:complete len:250 (+) Transcript_34879:3-752(+)